MFFLLKTQARFPASLAAKVHTLPPGAGEICRRGCCAVPAVPAEGLKRCEAVPVPARSRERQRPGAKRCRDPEGVRPVASGGRWGAVPLSLIGAEIMRPRCWCSSCLKGDRVPALVLIGASCGRWAAGAP